MTDILKLISTFVDAVAMMMALVLVVSLFERSNRSGWNHNTMMGAVFSLSVVFTMSDPIILPGGAIYDMRTLLIGAAIALLGPTVGIMALATGLAYRWGIGGAAVFVGMFGIALTFIGGAIWRIAISHQPWPVWYKSILLGIMISANSFAIWFVPAEQQANLLMNLVPYILASNILGCLLLHHLIRGEFSFVTQAERSRRDASTDHLTGLLNRRGLDLIYSKMAARTEPNAGWGLLYFDLDNFKAINDTYGHGVGDAVLRHVAKRVSDNLRPQDVFARLGGDEFAVVLSQIDARGAEAIAGRCRSVVAEGAFEHSGEVLAISISVGAIWMFDRIELDRFMDEADKALYVAKSGGRNRVVFNSGFGVSKSPPMAIPA